MSSRRKSPNHGVEAHFFLRPGRTRLHFDETLLQTARAYHDLPRDADQIHAREFSAGAFVETVTCMGGAGRCGEGECFASR